jgi:hypothetical protein
MRGKRLDLRKTGGKPVIFGPQSAYRGCSGAMRMPNGIRTIAGMTSGEDSEMPTTRRFFLWRRSCLLPPILMLLTLLQLASAQFTVTVIGGSSSMEISEG